MEMSTKIRDQNRGTTAAYFDVPIPPAAAKIIHEQLVALALLQANHGDLKHKTNIADSIVFVIANFSVKAYREVFDQPSEADMERGTATPMKKRKKR